MSMERQTGVDAVYDRIKPLLTEQSLMYLKYRPTSPVGKGMFPCILLMEGEDNIISRKARDFIGYPLTRVLQLVVEVWDWETGDVMLLREEVLKKALTNGGRINTTTAIREAKSIGPFMADTAGILGVRIIFEMTYTESTLF